MSRIGSNFNQNWQLPLVKTNKTDRPDSNTNQSNAQTQASAGANTLASKLPTVKIPLEVLQVQSGVTVGRTPQLNLQIKAQGTHCFQNEQQLEDYINAFKQKGKQPFKPGEVITIDPGTGDNVIHKTVLDDGTIVDYTPPAAKSSAPVNGTSIHVFDSYDEAITAIEVGAVHTGEDIVIADNGDGTYGIIRCTESGYPVIVEVLRDDQMKEIEARLRK